MIEGDSTCADDQRTFSESQQDSTGERVDVRQDEMFLSNNENDERLERIRDGKVPKPDDERKLFVGQLPADVTKEDLESYFEKFGSIEDVTIKYDVPGGRARGFAFILFDQKESIEKVLNVSSHFINQCQIDPKQAHRRPRESLPFT
jgi:RNA recognition motif-containing protein